MRKRFAMLTAAMLVLALCGSILTGCKKEEPAPVAPEPVEEIEDIDDFEEIDDDDLEQQPTEDTAADEKEEAKSGDLSNDEIVELAKKYSGAPEAELDQVMENGNLYIHLFEDMKDHTATIDWYEIDPKTLKGTNFEGEEVDLSKPAPAKSESEGDEGEGVQIEDGEYVTDEEYKGELSADGKTMTITTALSEYVNSKSPKYPKQTYVFTIADSCKVIEFQEDVTESKFADKIDLVKDFLEGVSGLPITFKFKNNEIIEIQFSS